MESLLCPVQTLGPPAGVPEVRAYKLGKKRWSYNQVELVLTEEAEAEGSAGLPRRRAVVQQAVHCAAKFPEAHQDSAVGFLIQLESGMKLQAHVYLCYDASQADTAGSGAGATPCNSGRSRGPSLVPGSQHYAWHLVTRQHCCKGCEGRVLRSIQRFGRVGKRAGGSAEPRSDGGMDALVPSPGPSTGMKKDPKFMYLSLDEACTHVDASAFRLVAGVYNRQGTKLLTTAVSPPIRVLANNDVPTGAARISLEAQLPADWEGWATEAASPALPKLLPIPRAKAAPPAPTIRRKAAAKVRMPAELPTASASYHPQDSSDMAYGLSTPDTKDNLLQPMGRASPAAAAAGGRASSARQRQRQVARQLKLELDSLAAAEQAGGHIQQQAEEEEEEEGVEEQLSAQQLFGCSSGGGSGGGVYVAAPLAGAGGAAGSPAIGMGIGHHQHWELPLHMLPSPCRREGPQVLPRMLSLPANAAMYVDCGDATAGSGCAAAAIGGGEAGSSRRLRRRLSLPTGYDYRRELEGSPECSPHIHHHAPHHFQPHHHGAAAAPLHHPSPEACPPWLAHLAAPQQQECGMAEEQQGAALPRAPSGTASVGTGAGTAPGTAPGGSGAAGVAAQFEAQRQLRLLRQLKAQILAASNDAASSGDACHLEAAIAAAAAAAAAAPGARRASQAAATASAPHPVLHACPSQATLAPADSLLASHHSAGGAAAASDSVLAEESGLMLDNLGLPLLDPTEDDDSGLHMALMDAAPGVEMLDISSLFEDDAMMRA